VPARRVVDLPTLGPGLTGAFGQLRAGARGELATLARGGIVSAAVVAGAQRIARLVEADRGFACNVPVTTSITPALASFTRLHV
jgi:hypothetical protein